MALGGTLYARDPVIVDVVADDLVPRGAEPRPVIPRSDRGAAAAPVGPLLRSVDVIPDDAGVVSRVVDADP